jgi:hypothetical protein
MLQFWITSEIMNQFNIWYDPWTKDQTDSRPVSPMQSAEQKDMSGIRKHDPKYQRGQDSHLWPHGHCDRDSVKIYV